MEIIDHMSWMSAPCYLLNWSLEDLKVEEISQTEHNSEHK